MRRDVSLRWRLTSVLVGTGVVATLLLATVAFFVADSLLQRRTDGQLATIRDDRVAAVERTLDQLSSTTSAMAADPGVAAAFADFARAWPSLGPDLDRDEQAALESTLADDLADLPDGLAATPEAAALVPDSVPGRRAQELYLATSPEPPGQRAELDDAGDGSDWSAAHAAHHPFLRELLASGIGSDLMFVSADGNDVVYSVAKHADFGTDVVHGPWADTGLAAAVRALPQLSIGDTAIVDSGVHPPAGVAPTMFLASAVRSGSEVLGGLVLAVPIAGLTDYVTADGAWDALGLGTTGQVYVVGDDGTLRTEPRAWREDPQGYLDRLADTGPEGAEAAELIAKVGSPVQVQAVTSTAIDQAGDGDDVVVDDADPLGVPSVTAASQVEVGGLDWILVTEQARSEATASGGRFLAQLGLLLLVLVPLIALLGWFAARTLVRPHRPVVEASAALASGDLDLDLPDLGTNELGDLARQLEGVAEELRVRRQTIAEEDQRIEDLLSAVVPPRLMERVRAGERRVGDVLETATVVIVTIVGVPDTTGADDDLVVDFTGRATREVERSAAEHGLEPATVASNQQRFLAGNGRPGTDATSAARFALGVAGIVRAVGEDLGLDVDARVGMAAGQVGTGLVGSSQVSFAVWGDPVAMAATLDGIARPGEVLVDAVVASELDGAWEVEPLADAVGLDDEPIEAWTLGPASDGASRPAAGRPTG